VPVKITGKLDECTLEFKVIGGELLERLLDISQPAVGESPIEEVDDGRADHAREEEDAERVVDLTFGELPCGANHSPDDRCCSKDLSRRADKPILLCVGTDAGDVGEHPRLNT